jgi:hypothetical protein
MAKLAKRDDDEPKKPKFTGFGLLKTKEVKKYQKWQDGLVHVNQHLDDEEVDVSLDSKDQSDWEDGMVYVHEAEEEGRVEVGKPGKAPVDADGKKKKKKKNKSKGPDLTQMASILQ